MGFVKSRDHDSKGRWAKGNKIKLGSTQTAESNLRNSISNKVAYNPTWWSKNHPHFVAKREAKLAKAKVINDEHPVQKEIFLDDARFKVVCCGRQWGKSILGLELALKYAKQHDSSMVAIIAPTLQMVKDIYWERLKDRVHQLNWRIRTNNAELKLTRVTNGSEIRLFSGEKPDRLRGRTLDFVVLDEVADMHEDLWPVIIGPTLIVTEGSGVFLSTPKGMNHFYEMYSKCQQLYEHGKGWRTTDSAMEDWKAWNCPSITSPFITEEEIESKKKEVNTKAFQQEYEASFVTFSGRAYEEYDRDVHSKAMELDLTKPLFFTADFNVTFMGWCIGQNTDAMTYIHTEVVDRDTNTWKMVDKLKAKLTELYGSEDRAKHARLIGYGDATSAYIRDAASTESSWDVIANAFSNWNFEAKLTRSNPKVGDRLLTFNSRLRTADRKVHFIHHPECKELQKDLELISYTDMVANEKTKAGKERSHTSDGVGYMLWREYPIRRRATMTFSSKAA